ncbi:MAG: hypothetical protein ACI8XB_003313 [Patiriisocius sp.]|jgi:hypothetical protein
MENIGVDGDSGFLHKIKKAEHPTIPIRNAGFLLNGRSKHLIKTANTLIWLLKMNKLKTKYKLLATCKFENSAFQIPHYA